MRVTRRRPLLPGAALVLAAFASHGAADMATIVTGAEGPTACMAPVHIRRIDGQDKVVPAQRFELAPGRHTLTGTATLDLEACPVGRGSPGAPVAPLEGDFEVGRTYYVGLDHSSPDRGEWALVIWKVE
jgi:hypothetical protein